MGRRFIGRNVFDMAVERMAGIYREGHRVLVSFSAGKDSGICLEVSLIAARMTNRLPVEVVMRDEEIMFPGTYEYAERCAARPEVKMYWLYANQPIINVFNRKSPYFWVFDPELPPEKWVRQPPSYAYKIEEQCIEYISSKKYFPPPEGKKLYTILGLRTTESTRRLLGLMSSGNWTTTGEGIGGVGARPIYDWKDGDVWKAIADNKWDYNEAYDVMAKHGVARSQLRIAPPTMTTIGCKTLSMAAKAWPQWFNRVCNRLEGVRTAAMFGMRSVSPYRRLGETWEECFYRECVTEAPAQWIADRALKVIEWVKYQHAQHSPHPIMEVTTCPRCVDLSSWKALAHHLYNGDPFCLKLHSGSGLSYVEPSFFRPHLKGTLAGTWGGKPNF